MDWLEAVAARDVLASNPPQVRLTLTERDRLVAVVREVREMVTRYEARQQINHAIYLGCGKHTGKAKAAAIVRRECGEIAAELRRILDDDGQR